MIDMGSSFRRFEPGPAFGRVVAPDDAAEALLREASRLVGRPPGLRDQGAPVALVLHLSCLSPPAPRPHHRRVARALMQDTAGWHGGQLFSLGNGDLVLLCREAPEGGGEPYLTAGSPSRPASIRELPGLLRRLLRVDTPPGLDPVSVWPLATHGRTLLNYARARVAPKEGRLSMDEDFSGQTGAADALGGFIGSAGIADLMQRQSAIVLATSGAAGIRPLYHEVTFSISGLEGRVSAAAPAASDPFLFRHLLGRLDRRMLEMLGREAGRGGPLDVLRPDAPPLHINLTVQGILSADFARLMAVIGGGPERIGVEISLIEAVADSAAFARARGLLAANNVRFVLDSVSHLALLMTRAGLFDAALIKLDWSPRLAELPEADQAAIDRALREIGVGRVVLHRAETEAALRWGLAHGIRRFQGRHVDAMLGAARIVSCRFADGCALRQCIERAGAANALGRAGCQNAELLDAGAPPGCDPQQSLAAMPASAVVANVAREDVA
jgi:EAL domain-containing protein (putative c-di-GMP-specific phosphodiesterase class I)